MAIAARQSTQPEVLTYADYLAEGETPGRYEIVAGVRSYLTSPHAYHQDIAQNIFKAFRAYARTTKSAKAYIAAMDIVTRRAPLQVRQPDVLLNSNTRWGDRGPNTPMPLDSPPELVVDVLSARESKTSIAAKVREYATAGVLECWLA